MYGLAAASDVTAHWVAPADIPAPDLPACPVGYAVGTFKGGLESAIKTLPFSLLAGPLNLAVATPRTSGSGNVLGPDGAPCHQSANTLPKSYYLGQALPGLVLVFGLGMWLFGGRKAGR